MTIKRGYFIILVVGLLIALANISLAANFERDLSYGLMNDPDVRELQKFLTEAGYFNGPVTGNFYDQTCTSLKNFQKTANIKPTCSFGPLTRAAVKKYLSEKAPGYINLLSPKPGDVWEYGEKYPIEYVSQDVARLGFEVRNGKTVVYRTEAPIPEGAGIGFNVNSFYEEKMGKGKNFSVRLFDWDNPQVFAESTGLLSIGSPAGATIAQTETVPIAPAEPKNNNVAELSAAVQTLLESIRNQVESLRQLRGF